MLYGCPLVPAGKRTLVAETTWDLPSLAAGATAMQDVNVTGARPGDHVQASLNTSSGHFDITAHVWSNDTVRVAARNLYSMALDIGAAVLSVEVTKRRLP